MKPVGSKDIFGAKAFASNLSKITLAAGMAIRPASVTLLATLMGAPSKIKAAIQAAVVHAGEGENQ